MIQQFDVLMESSTPVCHVLSLAQSSHIQTVFLLRPPFPVLLYVLAPELWCFANQSIIKNTFCTAYAKCFQCNIRSLPAIWHSHWGTKRFSHVGTVGETIFQLDAFMLVLPYITDELALVIPDLCHRWMNVSLQRHMAASHLRITAQQPLFIHIGVGLRSRLYSCWSSC